MAHGQGVRARPGGGRVRQASIKHQGASSMLQASRYQGIYSSIFLCTSVLPTRIRFPIRFRTTEVAKLEETVKKTKKLTWNLVDLAGEIELAAQARSATHARSKWPARACSALLGRSKWVHELDSSLLRMNCQSLARSHIWRKMAKQACYVA